MPASSPIVELASVLSYYIAHFIYSDAMMIIDDIKTVITELEQEQQMAPINVELVDNELGP